MKHRVLIPDVEHQPDMTVQEHIYRRLRSALVLGHFSPGKPVTIRGLATALETSPTPVREALRRLSSENGLTMLPNRRIVVPNMTPERFRELILLRISLECHAALRALPYVNDVLVDALTEIDDRINDAITRGDRDQQINENQHFHRMIFSANPDAVAMPMIESIWLQLGPFNRIAAQHIDELYKVDHHREAIAALRIRDEDALKAALEADIRGGVGDLDPESIRKILG
ncbi:MAG: GntR family transcriptional regulator [Rhizobiaceae bacterium]|nr:GntR family transcriptional regulator [Rhizobiaceae bacterium]